ncbi:DUF4112 domain-containing protein [Rhodovulum sp. 12E13]|uniref:DUF4112 domain-containing protein n=1 Tax=Rhodovulum sp. 12E13 TaxID=2203891 RepID=UPI000E16FD8B|nr:DUF4112 domain-containing protein [Rhodovulum sp. 12E13]RDC69928.1 DUF4112 domain-containing protein [Rhodovulum sp. 12E13]
MQQTLARQDARLDRGAEATQDTRRGIGPDRPRLDTRDRERQHELARLARLAHTLDARFRIPFTGFRVGVDGLIGLIPGIGDTLSALPSAYMIVRGHQLGARKRTLGRMAVNTGIDYVIGSVPLVGDLFDIGFKGNLRNIDLLRAEFGEAVTPLR